MCLFWSWSSAAPDIGFNTPLGLPFGENDRWDWSLCCCRASLLSEFGLAMTLYMAHAALFGWYFGLLPCFVWWFSLLRTFASLICSARFSPNSLWSPLATLAFCNFISCYCILATAIHLSRTQEEQKKKTTQPQKKNRTTLGPQKKWTFIAFLPCCWMIGLIRASGTGEDRGMDEPGQVFGWRLRGEWLMTTFLFFWVAFGFVFWWCSVRSLLFSLLHRARLRIKNNLFFSVCLSSVKFITAVKQNLCSVCAAGDWAAHSLTSVGTQNFWNLWQMFALNFVSFVVCELGLLLGGWMLAGWLGLAGACLRACPSVWLAAWLSFCWFVLLSCFVAVLVVCCCVGLVVEINIV